MRDYQTTFGIEVEAGGEPTPRAVALATAELLGAVENATVWDAHVHDEAHADAEPVDPHEMLTLGVSLSFSSDDHPEAIFGLPEQVEACETAQELGTGPAPGPGEGEDTVPLAEACNNCGWNDWHRYEPDDGIDVWFECATPGCGETRLNPGGQVAESDGAEQAGLWVGAPGPEWNGIIDAPTSTIATFVGGYRHPDRHRVRVWAGPTDEHDRPDLTSHTGRSVPEDARYVIEGVRAGERPTLAAERFAATLAGAYRAAAAIGRAIADGEAAATYHDVSDQSDRLVAAPGDEWAAMGPDDYMGHRSRQTDVLGGYTHPSGAAVHIWESPTDAEGEPAPVSEVGQEPPADAHYTIRYYPSDRQKSVRERFAPTLVDACRAAVELAEAEGTDAEGEKRKDAPAPGGR
jgi:hypothetical protein